MSTARMFDVFPKAGDEIDIAGLKDRTDLAGIAAMVTDLEPVGGELRGLCPLHDERSPSFYVNERKQVWHCHGCGRGGDAITLVMLMSRVGFVPACEWLAGTSSARPTRQRPSDREAAASRRENIARAKAEWRLAEPVEGTLAETYLKRRGLHGRVPGCLRFGTTPSRWLPGGGEGPRRPAMIAAVQCPDGTVTGIQRLFLDPHGRKARWTEPRLSLGQIRGGAVRMSPLSPTVMLATGVEDGLALNRMFPGATVWAALGDANLPHVVMPGIVRRVVLCGDDDPPGRAAVSSARTAYEDRRLTVDELFPRGGKDFADEWLLLHSD